MGEEPNRIEKFGGFTLDEVKTIVKTADSFNMHRGGLFDSVMELIGMKRYEGEDIDYPVELELHEENEMIETFVAICRRRGDGQLYTKSPEDYIREQYRKEEGGEPDDDVVVEAAYNMCQAGECYVPKDICGDDEYIGLVHTHPEYPVSPSCNDVEGEEERKGKVMCISSGDSFACLFLKKGSEIPCRRGDFDEDFCIPVVVEKEDVMGNYYEEEFRLCPEGFLVGHERAWINDVRNLVRKGNLAGVCWRGIGLKAFEKDEILCDFGMGLIRIKRDW